MIQTINPTMIRPALPITQQNDPQDALKQRMKSSQSQSTQQLSYPPIPVTSNAANGVNHRTNSVAESQRNDNFNPSDSQSHGIFRAPLDRMPSDRSFPSGNDAVPAGLAPSGMLRQHSSGTARFLESSLFDDNADPLSMDAIPLNPPAFFSQSSFDVTLDDRRKQDSQFSHQTYQSNNPQFEATPSPVHPVHLTNSNQSSRSNPSPQSTTRSAGGLPTFISAEPFLFGGYPQQVPSGEFQMNQSPRSIHPFFSGPDWQPPPNQRADSMLAMFRQNSDYHPASQADFINNNQSPANSALFSNNPSQIPVKGTLTRFLSGQNVPALESPEQTPRLFPRVVESDGPTPYSNTDRPTPQSNQNLSVQSIAPSTSAPSSPASHGSSHSRPTSPNSHGERRSANRHKDGEPRKKRVKREHDNDGDSVGSTQSHGSAKDRHVNTAVKLRTNEDDDAGEPLMQTHVRQIFYEKPDAKPHRIRLIEVVDVKTRARSMYAHGADVGSVVERKSNISRLFGKFTSPDEKLLMNVPGSHNHTVGQESNILTEAGIERFLSTNKMKGQDHYKKWILDRLIPLIRAANAGLDYDAEDASEHQDRRDHLHPGTPPGSIPSSPGSINSSNHSIGSYNG